MKAELVHDDATSEVEEHPEGADRGGYIEITRGELSVKTPYGVLSCDYSFDDSYDPNPEANFSVNEGVEGGSAFLLAEVDDLTAEDDFGDQVQETLENAQVPPALEAARLAQLPAKKAELLARLAPTAPALNAKGVWTASPLGDELAPGELSRAELGSSLWDSQDLYPWAEELSHDSECAAAWDQYKAHVALWLEQNAGHAAAEAEAVRRNVALEELRAALRTVPDGFRLLSEDQVLAVWRECVHIAPVMES